MASIKTKIVKIGNSQGVRIPKVLIAQCGLDANEGLVSMRVEDNKIVIEPVASVRAGWNEALARMNQNHDDRLILDDSTPNNWDEKNWEW